MKQINQLFPLLNFGSYPLCTSQLPTFLKVPFQPPHKNCTHSNNNLSFYLYTYIHIYIPLKPKISLHWNCKRDVVESRSWKRVHELSWLVGVHQQQWQKRFHGTVQCLWHWCWCSVAASQTQRISGIRCLRRVWRTEITRCVMRFTWLVRERPFKPSVKNVGILILLKRTHISMTLTMFSLA